MMTDGTCIDKDGHDILSYMMSKLSRWWCNKVLPPSGKSCPQRQFAKITSPFFRQTTQPSLHLLLCSVASSRAGRLLCRLAAYSVASPPAPSPCCMSAAFSPSSRRFSPSALGDQEGRDPLFCKARALPASAAALDDPLLVLEHLLQTSSSGGGGVGMTTKAWGRRRLAPHTCHCPVLVLLLELAG